MSIGGSKGIVGGVGVARIEAKLDLTRATIRMAEFAVEDKYVVCTGWLSHSATATSLTSYMEAEKDRRKRSIAEYLMRHLEDLIEWEVIL